MRTTETMASNLEVIRVEGLKALKEKLGIAGLHSTDQTLIK